MLKVLLLNFNHLLVVNNFQTGISLVYTKHCNYLHSQAKWEVCKRFNSAGVCTAYSGLSSRNKVKYDAYFDIRKDGHETYILSAYNVQPRQSGTYFCSVKTTLLSPRTQDFIHVIVYRK